MGRTLLAAFLGGLVASLLTFFLATALTSGPEREEAARRMGAAESAAETATARADLAGRKLDALDRRLAEASREHAESVARIEAALAGGSSDGAGPPGAAAADGSPYVSRAELEAALARVRAEGAPAGAAAPARQAKTLEEIVREMQLSSAEEASLRIILRESEEEAVRCVFGDRPLDEIADDAREARDDPEKLEAFVTSAVSNGFSNFGKLATLQLRTRKKVEGVLGKDRTRDFLARPRKPLLGEEFQRVFADLDLD